MFPKSCAHITYQYEHGHTVPYTKSCGHNTKPLPQRDRRLSLAPCSATNCPDGKSKAKE